MKAIQRFSYNSNLNIEHLKNTKSSKKKKRESHKCLQIDYAHSNSQNKKN